MRAERDMLDTLALVNLKIFLNLPLRTGVFVDGNTNLAVGTRHGARMQP